MVAVRQEGRNFMTPVLYILMRTDLPSMNAGKGMAQASHASNAFVHRMDHKGSPNEVVNACRAAWTQETKQGFGTVLVLSASLGHIRQIGLRSKEVKDALFEEILDPTYPYRVSGEVANIIDPVGNQNQGHTYDGNKEYTLVRPEVTCAYVFGDKEGAAGQLVAGLNLHP